MSGDIASEISSIDSAAVEDGIVVKSFDEDGLPFEVDVYTSSGKLLPYQLGFNGYGVRCNPFSYAHRVNLKSTVTVLDKGTFLNALNLEEIIIPASITNIIYNTEGQLNGCMALRSVEWLSAVSPTLLSFNGDIALKTAIFPNISGMTTNSPNYAQFKNCTSLEWVQLGSVGHAITNLGIGVFGSCTQSTLAIEIYCTGGYADTALAHARNDATNAAITIKASEATVYNGINYAAGSTIIFSEASV